ncbi:MAG: UDP-N-acetylmuramate--L-alanine ligase [Patescibacteria group bacterium]|jgi:UDP-N-acetylmuramate--alanine ligase
MIGIKGVGLTMLAQFLAARGHKVSGSDIKDTFLTDRVLQKAKIKVFTPFNVKNIPMTVDLIVYSSAYSAGNNPEMAYIKNNPAQFKGIKILSYAAALGEVFNNYYGLAVCGSHGKTTTAAWLGYVLWRANKKPNVLVGSRVPQFQGSSLIGKSKYFVAEVDEYQNKLQYFNPRGVVLNNIDYDHPDFFKSPASYAQVFADFVKKIPAAGFLIINYRDLESRRVKKHCRGKIISYDLNDSRLPIKTSTADYVASGVKQKNNWQIFTVFNKNKSLGQFKISLFGKHNILNALAVMAAARELKVPLQLIKKHLSGFKGTERRGQLLGKYRGALIIDDYAHHPTEIKTTLSGLKNRYPKKNLITVFHPHTFTRTKALFQDFVSSFPETNELIVLDIYGSARESASWRKGDVSSEQLIREIIKFNQVRKISQNVKYFKTISQAVAYLKKKLSATDLLVLMGAGDVFRIGQKLLK